MPKYEIRMSKSETISKFEYQMTKTLPLSSVVAQYLSRSSKISFVLNRIWNIHICFEFRALNFEFTKNKLSKKICYFTSLSMKMM